MSVLSRFAQIRWVRDEISRNVFSKNRVFERKYSRWRHKKILNGPGTWLFSHIRWLNWIPTSSAIKLFSLLYTMVPTVELTDVGNILDLTTLNAPHMRCGTSYEVQGTIEARTPNIFVRWKYFFIHFLLYFLIYSTSGYYIYRTRMKAKILTATQPKGADNGGCAASVENILGWINGDCVTSSLRVASGIRWPESCLHIKTVARASCLTIAIS